VGVRRPYETSHMSHRLQARLHGQLIKIGPCQFPKKVVKKKKNVGGAGTNEVRRRGS